MEEEEGEWRTTLPAAGAARRTSRRSTGRRMVAGCPEVLTP
jgi:hypothetical protein